MTTLGFDVFWHDHGANKGSKVLAGNIDTTRKKLDLFHRSATVGGPAASKAILDTGKTISKSAADIEAAHIRVERSAKAVTAAEAKYGKGSLEAREASNRMTKAQLGLNDSLKSTGASTAKAGKDIHRFRSVVGSIAGAFALVKGAQIFGGFIADARESAQIGRITAAVIKSTGGAAKVTAAQVSQLSASLSNKVGADDEAIQSGSNLLLTFTNIRNQVGKGNKIFDQATIATTDLAAALNHGEVSTTTMKSSSILLGKALNDPIKGVSALTRVGVSFTAQQKDQIKSLIKSGNTLGAQKIILREMQKEFGGAAKAAADPLTRLKVIAENLGESVGTALLPYIDRLATWVSSRVVPALIRFGHTFQSDILPRISELIVVFKAEVLPRLKDFVSILGDTIPKVVLLAKWIGRNKDFFVPFAATILTIVAAIKVWVAVQTLLNIVLTANPIGLVIVAIAALVGGLVMAYKRSETFRKIVDAAFHGVQKAAAFAFGWIKQHWPLILAIVTGPIGTAVILVIRHWGKITDGARKMKDLVSRAFLTVARAVLNMAGVVIHAAANAFGWVPGIGGKLRTAAAKFDAFRASVNKSLGNIRDQSITVRINTSASVYGTKGGHYVGSTFVKYARGGPVWGAGTATSDSIPAMLSNDEHVWTAKEVKAAGGHKAVESLRKGALASYATGGGVDLGGAATGRSIAAKIRSAQLKLGLIAAQRIASYFDVMARSMGSGSLGGFGWRKQWAIIHKAFPWAHLLSAYRPGARTVSGNQSYHALGRAIDVTPSMRIFDWIRSHYGRTTKELIYSPAGNRQIKNGSNHYYTGAVRRMHFNHVHWAYDRGGYLPPGYSMAYNGTGRPERVTPANEPIRLHPDDIRRLVEGVGRVVLAGIGASNIAIARTSDRLSRTN